MDNYISRQMALDALFEILDRPNHADFLYTDEICKALNTLPEQRWIPCSERLPKLGEVVLTQLKDDTMEVNHIIDDKFGEWFTDGVVAWIPLPMPYRKGE